MKSTIFKITLIASASSLVACGSTRIESGTEKVIAQTTPAFSQMRENAMPLSDATRGSASYVDAKAAAATPVSKRSTKPWHGTRLVAVQADAVLPPIFNEKISANFEEKNRNGRVSITVFAERLSRMTGVNIRVKSDVHQTTTQAAPVSRPAPPMTAAIPTPLNAVGSQSLAQNQVFAQQPSNFNQPITDVNSIDMSWDGTVAGLLNHVTSQLNLSWSYREGLVVIERFSTETFEIGAFGGTQDYKMSLSGSSSGAGTFGSANAGMDVSESGKVAALESLKQSLISIVGKAGGTVVLNEASGRFTVTAPKDVMTQVRDVVRAETQSMERQAHIQFDIYSVTRNDSNEQGFDFSAVINDLAKTFGATIGTPASLVSASAGKIGYTLLKTVPEGSNERYTQQAAKFGGSTALLQALNQAGNTAQYRPVSMVAMNRQWARKTSLKTTGYVSETTPSTSSSAGSGAPGLKTATVTTGDKFLVQPAILDNGTIILKMGVSLIDLLGLFNVSAGSGSSLQTVQTPETSGTDDQSTIRLNPGEQMIITGLSRRVASDSRNGFTEDIPFVLGGSKRANYKREDFMIVVRATQL